MKSRLKYIIWTLSLFLIANIVSAQVTPIPNPGIQPQIDLQGRYQVEMLASPIIEPANGSCPTTENNSVGSIRYINVDTTGDPTPFERGSSQVTISFPTNPNDCVVIAHAWLYWGGATAGNNTSGTGRQWYDPIKIKVPDRTSSTGYSMHTISPDRFLQPNCGNNPPPATGSGCSYLAVKDVSNLLRNVDTSQPQTFVVGDIEVALSGVDGGPIGGWTLVLVYESNAYTRKQFKLWDGIQSLSRNSFTLNMTNLRVPTTGTVDAFLGLMAWDGDGNQNDNLTLFSGGNNIDLDEYVGRPGNFFQNRITRRASDSNPADALVNITRNPNCENTLAWDAHHVNLPNSGPNAIPNGATSASLTIDTGDQQLAFTLAYIAIETNEPNLIIGKEVNQNLSNLTIDPNALENTELTYRVTVTNRGKVTSYSHNSNNPANTEPRILSASITDALPAGLDLRTLTDGTGNEVDGIKVFFFDETGDWLNVVSETNPDICYRYDPVTHTITVENYEALPVGTGFYVDIYTRLKPYDHPVWRNTCNRVIKNIGELDFVVAPGETAQSTSANCNTGIDLDASVQIEIAWDEGRGIQQIEDIPINNDPIVQTINDYLRTNHNETVNFTVFWCNDPTGDCAGDVSTLIQVQNNETFNDGQHANMVFVAFYDFGDGCTVTYIIRPMPSSTSFKAEVTNANVSCATGQGINNDGAISFSVDTRGQAVTFSYDLRNASGTVIAGPFSESRTNTDFEEIYTNAALVAGTYYIYVADLFYNQIPNTVVTTGYVDNVSGRLVTDVTQATSLVITEPTALTVPVVSSNSLERCLNATDHSISLSLTSGTGTDITFEWFENSVPVGDNTATLSRIPNSTGSLTYTVRANRNSCQTAISAPVTVQVRNVPNFTIIGLENTFCSNAGTAIAMITPVGENVIYTWQRDGVGNHTGEQWNLNTTGDATITVIGTQDFCSNTATAALNVEQQVFISGFTVIKNGVIIDPNTTSFDINDVVTVTVNATGDTSNLNYAWTVDGIAYGSNSATIQLTLLQSVNFAVNVRNPGGVNGCDAASSGRLAVCQAKFTMSPAAEVKRCAGNADDLVFTAIPDHNSSPIDQYILRLYNASGVQMYEEDNAIGRFSVSPSILNLVGREGSATITAIPACDRFNQSRWATQSVDITIYDDVEIYDLRLNGNSGNSSVEIRLGESVEIEVSPWDPDNHLYIINNDIWTLGNVFIDYPLNDKTYEVVLTNRERICSDTKLVDVKVKSLPTAILSTENSHFDLNNWNTVENAIITVIGDWKVFNRYGQEVFSDSGNVLWAGQDKNDKQLPPGTYFYVYTTPKGDVKKGTIELIK